MKKFMLIVGLSMIFMGVNAQKKYPTHLSTVVLDSNTFYQVYSFEDYNKTITVLFSGLNIKVLTKGWTTIENRDWTLNSVCLKKKNIIFVLKKGECQRRKKISRNF
jgi:hypothetical protein